jgi:hypothetical protein
MHAHVKAYLRMGRADKALQVICSTIVGIDRVQVLGPVPVVSICAVWTSRQQDPLQ